MNWDEVKELAPLYVIGALDAQTERAIESSLRDATSDQQREIAQWRDVAALLPQALPSQTPSNSLKERLLIRLASEAQETPIEIAVRESAEMAEQAEKKVLPFVSTRGAEPKTTRWVLIAATALLAFTSAYLFGQNARLAREREEIAKELNGWKQKVDDIVSPKTKIIAMAGDEAPQANAKVVWDTKTQQWVIYIFDLPSPPSDKEYQLWYVTKDAKISAAVFRPDAQGRTVLRLELPPKALAGLAATAVTLEPKGGSDQPTGKFYLKAII